LAGAIGQRLRRCHDAPIGDVWDVCTSPERIARRFVRKFGRFTLLHQLFLTDDLVRRVGAASGDAAGRGIGVGGSSRGSPTRFERLGNGPPARPSLGGSMLPWSAELAGQLEEHVITSELLRGNPLGDPHERPLWVYLPPGYDDDPDRRYPAVYVIQGYTGHLTMWRNRAPYRQPFTETADAVFASGEAPPSLVVYVDAWTAYGGSQFVNSPGTGRYHSYLCDEIVPWVDGRYRTVPEAAHRAIMGKSSGGFGAMITPMLRPDLFGALATHAGDALYELCYLPEFGRAARLLRDYDGDIWRWWEDFRSRVSFTKEADHALLVLLGVAACFSAHEDGTVDLPFVPKTGVLRPEVWERWLDWDPVRMVPRYAGALRSLRAVWIDAGTRDDFFLDLGAEAFRAALREVGVSDEVIRFELFDATHAGIDYRYPLSLAWLSQRISI
jgi:S-formylglutathione hydrolase FrmB